MCNIIVLMHRFILNQGFGLNFLFKMGYLSKILMVIEFQRIGE